MTNQESSSADRAGPAEAVGTPVRFASLAHGDIMRSSGDVAQLGERRVRNAKVEGSIPFVSTKFHLTR